MANKELFQKVRDLDLPKGKYALFGSAPLGIRNLKECNDADIIVTEDLWNDIKEKDGFSYERKGNSECFTNNDGSIEFWHNWFPWYKNIDKLLESAEIIDGLPFVKLEYVVEWKKLFGREKDLKDIERVEKFLKNNAS